MLVFLSDKVEDLMKRKNIGVLVTDRNKSENGVSGAWK